MTLEEFSQLVPGLAGMSHVEKIKHFGWFLLTQQGQERFRTSELRNLYVRLHFAQPSNLSQLCQQMLNKKPPDLLKTSGGFRLEARQLEHLDAKYADRPATIAVDAMLLALLGKVSAEAERRFLSEAISCFRCKAFRATIVMTWNVTYDHLINWILANHLSSFNAAIAARFPKRAAVNVCRKEDFADQFKESEVIEVCGKAGVIDDNTKRILVEKLSKRNMAAHPSLIEVTRYQAEETISDLVNNVILKLI